MYQNKYFVTKDSGTYAETLETYGLAKILSHIFDNNGIYNANIKIKDEGAYYSVSSNITVTEQMVNNTQYFDAFPYIKIEKDKNEDISGWLIDYKSEKDKRDAFKKRREIYQKEKDKKRQSMYCFRVFDSDFKYFCLDLSRT